MGRRGGKSLSKAFYVKKELERPGAADKQLFFISTGTHLLTEAARFLIQG